MQSTRSQLRNWNSCQALSSLNCAHVCDCGVMPLGMSETGFAPGAAAGARIAPVKGGLGGLLSADALSSNYPHDRVDFARGGHGLFSTLNDYAAFAHALLRTARGADGPRILSPATLAHATQNHAAAVMPLHLERPAASILPSMSGQGFGLGFAVSQPGGPLISRAVPVATGCVCGVCPRGAGAAPVLFPGPDVISIGTIGYGTVPPLSNASTWPFQLTSTGSCPVRTL